MIAFPLKKPMTAHPTKGKRDPNSDPSLFCHRLAAELRGSKASPGRLHPDGLRR
ncbi:hypothetical protein [Dactylosporangium maewongense]|uniref:hypothetical protein n=1 Tax=Dactylosporangium maewongense TaxID=634393 RepID=UPI0031DC1239